MMHYPAVRPVTVRWVEEVPTAWGHCDPSDGTFVIRLTKRGINREIAVSTLLHEWAHAITMPYILKDYHEAAFWTVLGEIEQHWKHGGGKEAAARLPLKRR